MRFTISISLISSLLCTMAYGSDLGFSNLTKSDFRKVSEEFATSKKHSTVTAGSLLPEDKKFEMGLILGNSQANTISKLSEASGATDGASSSIPYGSIYGVISLPKDFNAEVIFLPTTHSQGISSGNLSGAIKWSPKKYLDWPVNLATKAFGGVSKVEWEQTISGAHVEVTSTQYSYGLDAQVSKQFSMVEPYLNVGAIQTNGTIENSGSVSIFDSSFSSSNEEDISVSSLTFAIGAELDAWLMKIGVEYGEIYSNTYFKAKVSAQF